jgi:hypothetical protein
MLYVVFQWLREKFHGTAAAEASGGDTPAHAG